MFQGWRIGFKMESICSTCHWWTKSFGEKDGRSVCVWHSGTKDVKNRKVDFGGSKPFRTTSDFGCVCWSADDRKSTISNKENLTCASS